MSFASLSWYEFPETRPALDALWQRIARALREQGLEGVPDELCRFVPAEKQWASGELLLGQACGYDVLFGYRSHLQPVATPHFAAPGCRGPEYRSFLVVRDEASYRELAHLRGARCVINSAHSHSGMNALRHRVAPLQTDGRFFSEVAVSDAHEESLRCIARGDADVAAIDCVTWALLARHRSSALEGLRILERTEAAPAPPFVTTAGATAAQLGALRAALSASLADPELAAVRDALLLTEISVLPLEAYAPIAEQRRDAELRGYFELGPPAG